MVVCLGDRVAGWGWEGDGEVAVAVAVAVVVAVAVAEPERASAARRRRSNSACWSGGRRGGEGDWSKVEERRVAVDAIRIVVERAWRRRERRRSGVGILSFEGGFVRYAATGCSFSFVFDVTRRR